MPDEVLQSILDTLWIDLNSKDMVVLGALLKSQNNLKMFVDFEVLRAQLEVDEGGRKGKDPLVYRSLSALEKVGYIQVDRSEYKHGYNSNVKLIHNVFKDMIQNRIKALDEEIKALDKEIEIISNIDTGQLQSQFVDLIAGERELEKPVFAEGWENILQLLDDKIYRNLKKRDIVRITMEWLQRFNPLTLERIDIVEKLLKKGVIFRGLEHKKINSKETVARVNLLSKWKSQGYNPEYRINPREDATYQFIARNSEGLVLIVSEMPLSATWIPRESNPELVDDAIHSFDSDYESGVDVSMEEE